MRLNLLRTTGSQTLEPTLPNLGGARFRLESMPPKLGTMGSEFQEVPFLSKLWNHGFRAPESVYLQEWHLAGLKPMFRNLAPVSFPGTAMQMRLGKTKR